MATLTIVFNKYIIPAIAAINNRASLRPVTIAAKRRATTSRSHDAYFEIVFCTSNLLGITSNTVDNIICKTDTRKTSTGKNYRS